MSKARDYRMHHCIPSAIFPRSGCFANEFAISLISERARWTLSFQIYKYIFFSFYPTDAVVVVALELCFKFNDYFAAYSNGRQRGKARNEKENVFIFILTDINFILCFVGCSFTILARQQKAAKCSKFSRNLYVLYSISRAHERDGRSRLNEMRMQENELKKKNFKSATFVKNAMKQDDKKLHIYLNGGPLSEICKILKNEYWMVPLLLCIRKHP